MKISQFNNLRVWGEGGQIGNSCASFKCVGLGTLYKQVNYYYSFITYPTYHLIST